MKEFLLLIVGGVVALFGAFFGQLWTEKRERRNRRDELRLNLYSDVVSLILDNEVEIGSSGSEGRPPTVELQSQRISVSHRLKLLGSKAVQDAYREYDRFVFFETQPLRFRPMNPNDVTDAREKLVAKMRADIDGK